LYQVADDEVEDEKYDDDGQVKVEKTKTRYAESKEYAERKRTKEARKAEEEGINKQTPYAPGLDPFYVIEKKKRASVPNYKLPQKTSGQRRRRPSGIRQSDASLDAGLSFIDTIAAFCMAFCSTREEEQDERTVTVRPGR
jgi:NADPH-dependent glutamate synthase beta subunit-like oxidoreductase